MPKWRWTLMACAAVILIVSLVVALQGNAGSWWTVAAMSLLLLAQAWEARKAFRADSSRGNGQ